MKRPGPPKGSHNAQKEADPAESFLYMRITRERKSAYVNASRPGKLTDWAQHHLDRAAGYEPTPKPQGISPAER